MAINIKTQEFINRAQSRIAQLTTETAGNLYEAYADSSKIKLTNELIDVIYNLQSELLDWSLYDIEKVIDYYTYKAKLNDLALIQLNDISQSIIQSGTVVVDSSWIGPLNALALTVSGNHSWVVGEIERLDQLIASLDFSGLIPQQLLDDVEANTAARHTHHNKSILDTIAQSHIDNIAAAVAHIADSTIHVTSAQKTTWDNKVSQQQLTDGLATKANVNHTHALADVNGLIELLESYQPIPGPPGVDGSSPIMVIGSYEVGEELSITVDNTDPLFPQLNFVIPVGKDGDNFQIDVFGNAALRLSSVYNDSPLGFSYLGVDNGILYFRRPEDSNGNPLPATTSAGWYAVRFMGSDGWSPMLGATMVSDTRTVLTLRGWTGGSGNPPELGSDPTFPVYVGPTGFTFNENEAVNIRGLQGIKGDKGKILFPDESGNTADRSMYDDEPEDFVFFDQETGMIYKKNSNANGDWSEGFPWQVTIVDDSLIPNSLNPVTSRAIQEALASIGDTFFELRNGNIRTKDNLKLDAADITNLPSGGEGGHLQNTDQFLDFDGPNQVSAEEIRNGLDSLDDKVDKEVGKGLSTNDYVNEDKEKVDAVKIDGDGSKVKSDNGQYKDTVDVNSMVINTLNLYDHATATVGIWQVVNGVFTKIS